MNDSRGLWRGKTTPKKNGEAFNNIWVKGDLIHSKELYYIHPFTNSINVQNELGRFITMHEVDPSTLGECTGLTDRNGDLIFEGDILHVDEDLLVIVSWDEGNARFIADDFSDDFLVMDIQDICQCKIIGNIYDTPEIL